MIRTIAAAACLAFLVGPGGCASMRATSQPAMPAASNAELVDYISDQPFVTAEAGYRAVYVLWKGGPYSGEFSGVQSELINGKIVAGVWNHDPGEYLDRATVGYLVCRACGINTGLNWMLTGMGRYAWKELQYRGIAQTSGGELGLVTGGEFLGILNKAEEYSRRRESSPLGPPVDLGRDPNVRK
jgi:hypothetical protein